MFGPVAGRLLVSSGTSVHGPVLLVPRSTRKPVSLSDLSVHCTVNVLPLVASTLVMAGAFGTPAVMVAVAAGLLPILLRATNVNVYVVPLVSPAMFTLSG